MKTHFFFNSIPVKHRAAYRDYYTYQNLVSVRAGSMVFLILNIVVRLLYAIFPASLTKAQNFPEFSFSNWVFITITPIFLIFSNLYIGTFKNRKRATTGMSMLVFLFALYIVVCAMYSSFIATSDPSNALTLYLIGLSLISVTCVFEYYETIMLLVAVELFFTSLLFYAQSSETEMIYNQLISAILLSAFYLTSRYFFSYKATYYLQVIEIREKNLEIEKASEFKNQVLGMVAHDLRNPIAAVESIAMMMELDEVNEETQENIDMMKVSCAKARSIIDDLLEAARNENNVVFETVQTDLNKLLKSTVNDWKIRQGLTVDVVFTSTVSPANAQINNEKFHRVIDNLISNAVKFSKDNSKVDVKLNKQGNNLVIEVQDYGMGIPPAMIPKLFERFSGAGRAGVRGEQSTGIGLSIVREIVEKHHGTIDVESTEGKGSIFRIVMPVSH